ncbi:hypothetical protein ACN47E_009099 [Coniothyrium glycines]
MQQATSQQSISPLTEDEQRDCVPKEDRITIHDWSRTGRASHIDLQDHKTVPPERGRFLGRGSNGGVHEITINSLILAHKRILFVEESATKRGKRLKSRRKYHTHVLQLVGTYTQNKFLGIIMYPVAMCN